MLTKEQRDNIMNLYGEGVNISEIARKVGVSRHSVYRVIQSGIEQDPDIYALKKKLRKAKLEKSIWEVRKPMLTESRLDKFEKVMDGLISKVLNLCLASPKESLPQYCLYCGEELKYNGVLNTAKNIFPCFKCKRCRKTFRLPYKYGGEYFPVPYKI